MAQPATNPELTLAIATWAAGVTFEDLPEVVRHQVRRILADYLASVYAGSSTDPATVVRNYVSRTDTGSAAAVIGTSQRLSPAGAAIANGTAAHALDLDDGYTAGACHPGAPIVSAILAVGEDTESDADDIIRAIAVGYEVAVRIAGASHPAQRQRGFHNTALVGTLGAAAGVSVLLGATAHDLAGALGNAASHAGGLLSFLDEGSDIKRYHAGKAARDGLVSAELAIAGLRGPTTVLESPHGYFHAFTGDQFDREHLVGELGTTWRVLQTYNKPYPCCRHVHGAIDAALRIRQRPGFDVGSVEGISVETFAIAASHDRTDIENTMDAQMSLPYCVAVAVADGAVDMESFSEASQASERLRAMYSHVEVRPNDEYTASYPKNRPARVTIAAGGSNYVEEILQPYGEPSNPMSDADLDQKLRSFVTPVIGSDRTDELSHEVWSFGGTSALSSLLPAPS